MNRMTLLGIATQPKYDDNNHWTGAEICANIEIEAEEGLHRVCIKLEISKTFALAISVYGFKDGDTGFLMKRVQAGLDVCTKKWPGTERDANNIYEVMRLKMPRFVIKSANHVSYSWRAETGDIDECTEEMLDRRT